MTPRKVLSEKNIVTPSLPSPYVNHHKKKMSNLAFAMASALASNAKSDKVFRLKRRNRKAPPIQKEFTLIKKICCAPLDLTYSSSSSNQISEFNSLF